MGDWRRVGEEEFAHVYDTDYAQRIDLTLDDSGHLLVNADRVVLDLTGVQNLRRLLQAVERKAKREGLGAFTPDPKVAGS